MKLFRVDWYDNLEIRHTEEIQAEDKFDAMDVIYDREGKVLIVSTLLLKTLTKEVD